MTTAPPASHGDKVKKRIEYAGPYRLLETVGTYFFSLCLFRPWLRITYLFRGGMATVKVAMDPLNGRKVAVKIVDKEKLHNPREQVRRLPSLSSCHFLTFAQVSMAREITIMKLLRHPNVLRLYDIYETEDKMCVFA